MHFFFLTDTEVYNMNILTASKKYLCTDLETFKSNFFMLYLYYKYICGVEFYNYRMHKVGLYKVMKYETS